MYKEGFCFIIAIFAENNYLYRDEWKLLGSSTTEETANVFNISSENCIGIQTVYVIYACI